MLTPDIQTDKEIEKDEKIRIKDGRGTWAQQEKAGGNEVASPRSNHRHVEIEERKFSRLAQVSTIFFVGRRQQMTPIIFLDFWLTEKQGGGESKA